MECEIVRGEWNEVLRFGDLKGVHTPQLSLAYLDSFKKYIIWAVTKGNTSKLLPGQPSPKDLYDVYDKETLKP